MRGSNRVFPKIVISLFLLFGLTGCADKPLSTIFRSVQTPLRMIHENSQYTISLRTCALSEVERYFSNFEDLYHYYYLIHVRVQNKSPHMYVLHPDKASFFIPPASFLEKYTSRSSSVLGIALSVCTTLLSLPFYLLNVAADTLHNPHIANGILVTRQLGIFTGIYMALSFGPALLGIIRSRAANKKVFLEAERVIVTQNKLFSVEPQKTTDFLFLTPRAGFPASAYFTLYNYRDKCYEKVSFSLDPLQQELVC